MTLDEKNSKENLIHDIHVLQTKLKQYIDIRTPFKLTEDHTENFDFERYQKMNRRSLELILQSLQEQIQFYEEADANPIDIKKPKNMPVNVFFDIFLNSGMATIIENDLSQTILINQQACNLFGYSAQELLSLHPTDLQHITQEKSLVPIYTDGKLNRFTTYETNFKRKDGSIFPGELRLIRLEYNVSVYVVAMITDISKRKRAEAKQQALIVELQEALSKIQQLQKLVPVCGMCKKIRNDQGYWNQLDTFVQEVADVSFSYELCPDCKKKNWRLILSYFDAFFGPIILHFTPKDEKMEEFQDLPLLLDYEKEGYFEMTLGQARILNLQYKLSSMQARGQHELIMISFAVFDGNINEEIGKEIIEDILDRMLKIENVEIVFNNQSQKTPEGMAKFKEIEEIFQEVYNSIENKLKAHLY
ncbi:PAS domain-containing protein [Candidatus Lokiarchaeum ossiferum]|uniref:PAS domain-containing protein n=1 Tax=Candidatus Lokiarchaeum ossiferum TaxID=2951803 RepID=UPI00352C3AF7